MAVLATPAGAAVTVCFVEPAYFTDADDSSGNSARTLLEIGRYLKALGHRYLSPQESLKIEVLNIDLAGRIQQTRSTGWDVRFVNGEADWPRIEVRYTLESQGRISGPVEETIVDMTYLRRVDPQHYSAPLPYEKRMLDEWFRARFVEHQPPR